MTEQELLQYRDLKEEEERLRNRIEELNSEKVSIKSPSAEPSYGGNGEDRITALIDATDKLTMILEEKLISIRQKEAQIEKAIEILDGKEKDVIVYYYMRAMDWSDVALTMRYSEAQIYRYRYSALIKLLYL